MCASVFVLTVWAICDPLSDQPQDWGPFIKLFGANPLGIPTGVAATALISLFIWPWVLTFGYGFDLALALKNMGYRHPGLLSMVVGAVRNWRRRDVRGPALKILIVWAGYWMFLQILWLALPVPK